MLHEDLKRVCKALSMDLSRVADKIESAGNVMSSSDLDYVDKLTHAIKSVKTTMAMISATEERETPHVNDEVISKLKDMMEESADEYTRNEFHNFISRMESM